MELVRVDTMKAFDEIKRMIIHLQLAPGSPIDEDALSKKLDLAPSAVREALKLLVHDNLIVVTPRHGIRVADANPADLRQLFEMRLPMEKLCAEMAAGRATDDDIMVLEAVMREAEQARKEGDVNRLLELDERFHIALADAAHNRYMRDTLAIFHGLSERLWHMAMPEPGWLEKALDLHIEMVGAVKARDAGRAGALMEEHVLDFQRHVEKELHI